MTFCPQSVAIGEGPFSGSEPRGVKPTTVSGQISVQIQDRPLLALVKVCVNQRYATVLAKFSGSLSATDSTSGGVNVFYARKSYSPGYVRIT